MKRKSLVHRIPLAPACAALMGVAMAFFLAAMPIGLLERGVSASGVAHVLSAANPPLGNTARALVASVVALFAAAVTGGAISFADILSRLRSRPPREDEVGELFPAETVGTTAEERRPLFAATDLGEPIDDDLHETAVEPLPALADSGEAGDAGDVEEAAPESAFDPLEVSFDDVLELVTLAPEEAAPALVSTPAPAPVPAPAPAGPPATLESLSIGQLMERLETGAERRSARAITAPRPATDINGFDGALRSALEELQRFGSR